MRHLSGLSSSLLLLSLPKIILGEIDFIRPDLSQPLNFTEPIIIEWAWVDGDNRTDISDRWTELDIKFVVGPAKGSSTPRFTDDVAINITSSPSTYEWDASHIPARLEEEGIKVEDVDVSFQGEARNPNDKTVPTTVWDSGAGSVGRTVNIAGAVLALGSAAWLL
ncbi:hypothetical protein B0T11DRAFT_283566 [Plectosphaerella cucumerina]|uniref:Uncharacterized protein n=1 Tax=Plectosphaerella cucumerina TaxID=40658 RepID=A0A8K0T828_9PEZI|nr:hypothetical protein B0T11DRAFT_283566 [Plectosphaerella cucumerina]